MSSRILYDISEHRKSIDEVDQKIYKLLRQRMDLIHEVKKIKQKYVKQGSSIRPARAIEVIRNACHSLIPHYHRRVIINIWRNLISISEYNEQEFSIIALDQDCCWLGKEFFGNVVEAIIEPDIEKLISYLCRFDGHFGFVPFPDHHNHHKWWVQAMKSTLRVFSIAPLYTSRHAKALAIGHVVLEPTNKHDFTLLVINDLSLLQEDYLVLDKEQDLYLVQVNQFYDEQRVVNLGASLLGNYSLI